MRSAIALSVAALVGSALAAPSYGGYGSQPKDVKNVHVVVETVVKTLYVTDGYQMPKPTNPVYEAPAKPVEPVYEAPAKPVEPVYEAPAKPTMVYEPVKPTPAAPSPTSEAPKPTTAPPPPSTGDYMDIVSEWRAKLGLSDLKRDAQLEKNAKRVVVEGKGVMVHNLYEGSMGQVLAPGEPDLESFIHVFVGGWLCEIPTLPGLNGICKEMSKGWSYEGQTGHAEILVSEKYTKIGCANDQGIWCCDVA